MRRILIIGMGTGHPEHITIQAINALNRCDVLFLTDKGAAKDELARVRREVCERYVAHKKFRTMTICDPDRDRNPTDYEAAVDSWHEQRAGIYEALFLQQLSEGECGAFLVWGDPSLYDSTLRIVTQIARRGAVELEYEVIPGITSIQALTAGHRIALNQIGAPVQITTGRRLAAQPPSLDTVVMLNGECAFDTVDDDMEIYWGAYLGTPDQILLSGKVGEMSPIIQQTRAAARRRKGWIMDTYLLRKPPTSRR